jgi:hypothetical protein
LFVVVVVVLFLVVVGCVKKQRGDTGGSPASEGRMNRDDEELLWSCSGATGPTCLLRLSLHQALLMEGLVYFLRGGEKGVGLYYAYPSEQEWFESELGVNQRGKTNEKRLGDGYCIGELETEASAKLSARRPLGFAACA